MPLSREEWNKLARESSVLPDGCELKDFQVECANRVISREGDLCVISPTGSGKSLLWILPLLAQKHGVVMVITPYTSLGSESESR
jgi:superfamily II DNA helicase RecQ